MTQILNFKITEPLLRRLLACKVDSWSQSVIDYQRGRKEDGSFWPFTRLSPPSTTSIKVWPRAEKILSNSDWLVVIKHSKEFAFVLLKIGRGSGVLKTNGQFSRRLGWTSMRRCNWQSGDKSSNEIDVRTLSKPLLISPRMWLEPNQGAVCTPGIFCPLALCAT